MSNNNNNNNSIDEIKDMFGMIITKLNQIITILEPPTSVGMDINIILNFKILTIMFCLIHRSSNK